MKETSQIGPALPRRVFLAAGLSAVFAGSAVALGLLGGLSRVHSETFQFSRGTSLAAGEEARLRALLVSALNDDRIHVTIIAHTGSTGDVAANQDLSDMRAEMGQSIARDMGLATNRITARGVGGGSPAAKQTGESDRAHQSRLARMEVALQMRR
ncbi:MAG: OmpA family protein [Pseudomonadota bacterium]